MASIFDSVISRLEALNADVKAVGDPRIGDYPLMDSMYPQMVLCFLYVIIVYAGMRFMKTRPPIEMRSLMVGYNFGMVALNGFIVAELIRFAWLSGYSFRCAGVPPGDSVPVQRVVRAAFLFWATKIIEFSDTFMFVARKKHSQITFLHVFHHFAVPLSTWFGVKVVPGGHGAFFATVNSFVHVVMYTYYGISALGPAYHQYLWWKPWMTRVQLIQFVALYLHSAQLFFDNSCNYPIIFGYAINIYSIIFFILFMDYYLKAYRGKDLSQMGAPVRSAVNGEATKVRKEQ